MEKLDCLQVKTGEVIPARFVQAEELAGIADARVPPAEHCDHGPVRDRPVLPFPCLEVIGRELCIRLRGGMGPNIHNHQWPNQLVGGNAVGAQALRAVQRRVEMGAAVFLQVPAIGVPFVLTQLADLLHDKGVRPCHGEAWAEGVREIDNPLEAVTRRLIGLGS